MKKKLLLAVCMAAPSLLLAAESVHQSVSASNRALLDQYCVICHNQAVVNSLATSNEGLQTTQLRNLGLTLDTEDVSDLAANPEVWEKVIKKLRVGVMPPPNYPRPDKVRYDGFRTWLEDELDSIAANRANPGRTQAFHRLNQTEYRNSIRDLLDLNIDVSDLIPADAPDQYGFDNNAEVLALSPLSVERYVNAAHKIAELAIGAPPRGASITTYDVPLNLIQDDRLSEDLPFGSRGGTAIEHLFPIDGEYRITLNLQTNYVDFVRGFDDANEVELSLDGEHLQTYAFGGDAPGIPAPYSYAGNIRGSDDWEEFMMAFADEGFELVLPVKAGPRVIGATFPREMWEAEGVQQPRLFGYQLAVTELPDGNPGIGSVEIEGPLSIDGSGITPSRQQIFSCEPISADEEPACARQILSSLARRAYRRAVTENDVQGLMEFYKQGQLEGGFETGIQFALERLLVSPDFLFRIEQDPRNAEPDSMYPVTDTELASRLSFFLWSSLPDDELLDLVERSELRDPGVLETQVKRMMSDSRSSGFIENFVGQWLYLRNLDGIYPDPAAFPEFDENLREAFQRETELFIDDQIRSDRSLRELLSADYTYVNERLAEHYGIPKIYGNRYRKVMLEGAERGGLFGHGSLMMVTSYPNRTSPVLRGKFVLENLLGGPPPEPPPNVPALETSNDGKQLTMREAMAMHRENPACRVCHAAMDPIGFSLENYDAVGKWRTQFAGQAIDASGLLPDGNTFDGPDGLRGLLLERPDDFVGTITEKLMRFALGRSLEYYDMPEVRGIVRAAREDDYRWSSVILGVIKSAPFQMRGTEL
ncbi:DUF1592 domain-containing protein [bacterium]|jgi:hypothetical protein|nr:DUF1592 domain-containing protein [bacterium]MDB2375477.1 DUF1592 domain-containing protein [Gammaproteobacteria bacterium]